MRSLVLILLCGLLFPALTGFKRANANSHTKVELIAETASVAPGTTAWLALRMQMDPGWHTYWVNPGEFGESTKIEWANLPKGVKPGEFHWPAPHLYDQSGIINYVYEDEVLLIFPVKIPTNYKGENLTLKGQANWLECDESQCVPGSGAVAITLPIKTGPPSAPSKWAEAFKQARANWPQDLSANWQINASDTKDGFVLTLTPQADANSSPTDVYFFSRESVVAPAEPQPLTQNDNGSFTLSLTRSEYAPDSVTELNGVLTSNNGWLADGGPGAMAVQVKLNANGSGASSSATNADTGASSAAGAMGSTGGTQTPLGMLLLFAFVGGLILNLMPCVFPVLGLKVMGFVKQGGESRGRIFAHGLVYTLGVLISFWVLAAVLLTLRAGGEQLGWGFQLQSPGFVLAMTVVLLAFGLNMSGVFEVGMSAVGVGSNLTAKSGLSGSFFSGVLATLVATPCAAPFLAPALGAALALPTAQSVLLFTVIGLGLSSPYLLFSLVPKLAKALPRPGAWMDTFKKWLSFLLYATVAYLVWILAGLVEAERFLNLLFALVGVSLACWLYGHYGTISSKRRGLGIAGAVIVLGAALGLGFYHNPPKDLVWQKWSPELVEKLRAQDRIVYVDFTARWCATCQVNKRVVFGSDAVLDTMRRDNVALLKADWTAQDPIITEALASFGKSAVPFNLIYSPHLKEPLELPSILTPDVVIRALNQAAEK